jgi:hypothetical protein
LLGFSFFRAVALVKRYAETPQEGDGGSNVAAPNVEPPVFDSVACSYNRCATLKSRMP